MKRRGHLGWWLAAALLLAVLPVVPGLESSFSRSILSQMGIAAVFALSYSLLLGQTGLLSFGHAVYFGLGGYAAGEVASALVHGADVTMPPRGRLRRSRPCRPSEATALTRPMASAPRLTVDPLGPCPIQAAKKAPPTPTNSPR